MTLRLLGLFLTIALAGAFGQFDFPGAFGKITSHPKVGDLAPEINFAKVLHNAASDPWSSANLNGRVTVIMFLPYVTGNPDAVNRWNALVEQFTRKPVQFAWITDEDESVLLPFLKEHPIQGWVFRDPDGATGRAYGLELPQLVIVGVDRTIVGFDGLVEPRAEVIDAVLENRITTTSPKPTLESLRVFSVSKLLRLSPEPVRMPRPDDHRPDFSPSYTVHVAPAKDQLGGGNYSGMDFWSLQGYTVKRLLAEMLDINPIRIELPASVDTKARYDFSIVLPKDEDKETKSRVMLQGVEDYFHLGAVRESRLRDVYVLTASDPKLPASARDPLEGGAFSSSVGYIDVASLDDLVEEKPHAIEAITGVSMGGFTVDEFCAMLERSLDRPLVNETKLDGRFDFRVPYIKSAPRELPKFDFVERLRSQLGLVIASAQRNVETVVYRLR
jgi:uncharacterized protein (TIGR03435 family)